MDEVKVPGNRPEGPEGSRGIALIFLDLGTLEVGGWSAPRPGRFTPGKTRYPLYRRLGGPQGRSGRVRKISAQQFRSSDRPTCSHSLYRLSYRGPETWLRDLYILNEQRMIFVLCAL
jgi:hypothetical protein